MPCVSVTRLHKFRISEFDFVVFRNKNFSTSVDWEIFTLKIICVKKFVMINFRGSFDLQNVFNSWRLQNGWVPGAFLVFSQLPRYQERQLSLVVMLWLSGVFVDGKSTSEGVDIRTRLLVDNRCVHVFSHMSNFCGWSEPWNYFNKMFCPWALYRKTMVYFRAVLPPTSLCIYLYIPYCPVQAPTPEQGSTILTVLWFVRSSV